jgi:RNA polymerase sigma-70 factor (ECF subfamily)
MFNTSHRIVNNAADAEDIVQDAFIEVFRNMDRFTYQSTFGVWMKRIVINKSINHLRQKRYAFVDITAVTENGHPDENAPDEETINLKVETIRKAVYMLPDGYRTIFTLRAFEEYDYEAIAELFAISPVTARTQYHRAKKLLLTLLKQHV